MQIPSINSKYCDNNKPAFGKIRLTNNAKILRTNLLSHYENECLDKLIKDHESTPGIITVSTDLFITKAKNSVGKIQDFYFDVIKVHARDKTFEANGLDGRDNFEQITKAVEYLKGLAKS